MDGQAPFCISSIVSFQFMKGKLLVVLYPQLAWSTGSQLVSIHYALQFLRLMLAMGEDILKFEK